MSETKIQIPLQEEALELQKALERAAASQPQLWKTISQCVALAEVVSTSAVNQVPYRMEASRSTASESP